MPAKTSVVNKQNYLKYNLSLLNKINTSINQITIMKPKIDDCHAICYTDYYNFDNIDISNIKDKIKIIECENKGISYGQFLTGIYKDTSFDYYVFIEDDYICFSDNFEIHLKNYLNSNVNDSYLCMFYYNNKTWIMKDHLGIHYNQFINNNIYIYIYDNDIINKMNDSFYVPDYSCGIISKKSFLKIIDRFGSFDKLINLFNINDYGSLHQIIFGFVLYLSNISICDISSKNVNLFYSTGSNVNMCNFPHISLWDWKSYLYNNEKFDIPIFVPIQFFYPYEQYDNINELKNIF